MLRREVIRNVALALAALVSLISFMSLDLYESDHSMPLPPPPKPWLVVGTALHVAAYNLSSDWPQWVPRSALWSEPIEPFVEPFIQTLEVSLLVCALKTDWSPERVC